MKSSGFGKTSLNMSMILFDEIIEMLNGSMIRVYIKTIIFQFLVLVQKMPLLCKLKVSINEDVLSDDKTNGF
ncbi:hypothetical protein BK740_27475 [Bacillus thuringiensis serovar argentinensis]|nr:hypothetical protein BK740_27475 [Bacillus thuringiensis serovar argentinensis]